MNVNNLVINRALRFMMVDRTDGHLMMNILDVKEPSLSISGEPVYATDSVGKKIAAFDRDKEASFSCQSTLFDLNLFAAQSGVDKVVASSGSKVKAPVIDMLTSTDGTSITLSKTPVENSVMEIGLMGNDGSVTKFFKPNVSETESQFAIAGTTITLPTATVSGGEDNKGTRWFVTYETELQENAVSVSGDADASTKTGKGILEVLFCDPCDQNTEYYGYLVFPNAKLKNEIDMDLNTESSQSFTIEALQDWCSADKKLYELIVVGDK